MIPAWNDIRPVLNTLRKGFPVAEAQAVLDHTVLQDALLSDLERLADAPDELLDAGMLHIIGMMLLAEKRNRRLAAPLLKLTSGSEDDVESLWGDFLTEDWDNAAAAVCSSEELKVFFENEAHSPWARAMASSALTIQVYEGDLDRRSTIDYAVALQEKYLQQFDSHPENGNNLLMFDFLADIVGDLGDTDDFRHLERWFGAGLLDPTHAGIDWYKRELASPYESRRQNALERSERYLRDAIARLSGAYCYSAEFHSKKDQPDVSEDNEPFWPGDYGTFTREAPKVGRNDPCPCGSGKKYKKCCGT